MGSNPTLSAILNKLKLSVLKWRNNTLNFTLKGEIQVFFIRFITNITTNTWPLPSVSFLWYIPVVSGVFGKWHLWLNRLEVKIGM